jgi:hypothetical protein
MGSESFPFIVGLNFGLPQAGHGNIAMELLSGLAAEGLLSLHHMIGAFPRGRPTDLRRLVYVRLCQVK